MTFNVLFLRCALSFLPQDWVYSLTAFMNRAQGLGPTPEALRRTQQP